MPAPLMPDPGVAGGEQGTGGVLNGAVAHGTAQAEITDPFEQSLMDTDALAAGRDTDEDGVPDVYDVTPTGGEQTAWSQPGPSQGIKNWPKRWNVRFNPPAISYASGQRVRRRDIDEINEEGKPVDGRDLLLGGGGGYARTFRKGWLTTDTSFAADFVAASEGGDAHSSVPNNSLLDISAKNPTLWGFRFMYNPASLDFSVSTYDGVNVAYIFSGKNTAQPTGVESSGSMITLSLPITRVDDMQAILAGNERFKLNSGTGIPNLTYPINNAAATLYARAGNYGVDENDLKQIARRGTGYDLEFLFRAVLGRQWKTAFRGNTADVGLVFSLPLRLYLSNTMVYRVRMRGISYTHKSFTTSMVPLHTILGLTFERIPDVIGVSP